MATDAGPLDTFPKKLSWDMALKVGPTPVPGRRRG